jgi:hypothetical protein
VDESWLFEKFDGNMAARFTTPAASGKAKDGES